MPARYYVYAYIDPVANEPFYIGKGTNNRAYRHLRELNCLQNSNSFFYHKLRKMLLAGIQPIILIIKDNLTEEVAFDSEYDLMCLIGTRINGTGPLCNTRLCRGSPDKEALSRSIKNGTAIEIWKEEFASLATISRDPRCVVSADLLSNRLSKGWNIEDAATTPALTRGERGFKVICWGEEFNSHNELSRDSRSVVSACVIRDRLSKGWDTESAATEPILARVPGIKVTCWSEEFVSYNALAKDPRCVISANLLRKRLSLGWDIESAATAPAFSIRPGIKVTCWDEEFISYAALTKDSRCVVSVNSLRARLYRGWNIERAATTPVLSRAECGTKVTCWNEEFISYAALTKDSRCVVSADLLRKRLSWGWDIESAAGRPIRPVGRRS